MAHLTLVFTENQSVLIDKFHSDLANDLTLVFIENQSVLIDQFYSDLATVYKVPYFQ